MQIKGSKKTSASIRQTPLQKKTSSTALGSSLSKNREAPEKIVRRLKPIFVNLPEISQIAVLQALINGVTPEEFLNGIILSGNTTLPTFETLKAEKCLERALECLYSASSQPAVSTLLLDTYPHLVRQQEKQLTRRQARLQAALKNYEAQAAARAASEK